MVVGAVDIVAVDTVAIVAADRSGVVVEHIQEDIAAGAERVDTAHSDFVKVVVDYTSMTPRKRLLKIKPCRFATIASHLL